MDFTFNCPKCNQELEVDLTGAGQTITCPTCNSEIEVPKPDIMQVHALNPISASAAAKEEKHFSVPVHDTPTEVLVKKPVVDEEEEIKRKGIHVRIFRHSDCVEVGHDRYEEIVSDFLNRIGEKSIISISPLAYTHLDIGTQKILTDYAIQIIYRF